MNLERNEPPSQRSARYLPVLTWTLLAMMFVYLVVWFLFYRPTEQEELQVSSFREALRFIDSSYVRDVDREEVYRAAMRGMVRSLKDRYSYYLSPAERRRMNEATEGEYAGIGVRVGRRNGTYIIEEVFENGPAAASGMREGDILTHVDDEEASVMGAEELVSRIRGEPGSEVRLGIKRPPEGELIAFSVERQRIDVPNVRWLFLEEGIARLRIESFDKNVADEVSDALKVLAARGLHGLVLDLRGNGGGVMSQAVRICDMVLSDGLILSLTGREVPADTREVAHARTLIEDDVPVAVLVDRFTASAAEIVAGALQANGRAIVVGTGTVGKGSVTTLRRLPDGSGIVITIALYELANGTRIEAEGVRPDIIVGELQPFPAEDLEKADEWHEARHAAMLQQQEAALEWIRDQLPSEPEDSVETNAHKDRRHARAGE